MIKNDYKNLFPVSKKYVFLNNAAESPMNMIYRSGLDEYLDIVCQAPQTKPGVRLDVKTKLAKLLGGRASDYALITSTGVGVSIVAMGLNFKFGDNIVIPEDEHRNNIFPWLALKEKCVEIRYVPVSKTGLIKVDDIENLIDDRTVVVSLAAVRFNSGFRSDLKKISELAHKKNALFFVDAIQAAGIVPINVEDMGVDVLSCAGFKWLLGAPGTGCLYVNEKARKLIKPILPGMFAAENSNTELKYFNDSRMYETGSIAYSLFYAWQRSLDFLIDIGIENIYAKILMFTDLLIKGLRERNVEILSEVSNKSERSAILFFTLASEKSNHSLEEMLKENNVIIAVRDGKCRISPSFYNSEKDIEEFFRVLDIFLK
ncbi:MAG: aminotransferase class V-fold PLP-dependent enzyme [Acidaminobacteraceae bacterium]